MNAEDRIAEFRRATERLAEALAAGDANPLFVDAAIQRFEFCVELAWKSLREVLARDHGVNVASPKPALQEAYRLHLIDDEAVWLDMLRDRNLCVHTYREALAREIYQRLPRYAKLLAQLAARL
jgi:nucleotidyltransferase substrate binding protein (TIGR01987 family)